MTYVVIITNPSQTIQVNLAQGHLWNFRLVEYYASGLINQDPLFLRFMNQPMTSIFGNLPATSIPLLWQNFPNSTVILNNALPITNGQNFTDCHQLQIRVEDLNQKPATFGKIVLIFKADVECPEYKWKMSNLEKSLRQA